MVKGTSKKALKEKETKQNLTMDLKASARDKQAVTFAHSSLAKASPASSLPDGMESGHHPAKVA